MLRLEDLHKYYHMGNHDLHVLKGVNLEITEGEFVSIMGSSGSGKSTMLNIIGLLDDYDSGAYYLDNKLISKMNEKEAAIYRNNTLGFVFQSFNLISSKDALENVGLPLFYRGMNRKRRNELAMEYLELVGLADRANHLPRELSGGQQQRVAIARALVSDPKIVLADEPTGALDTKTSYEIMDMLSSINDKGKTVVVITHEDDISKMTKKTIRLKDGLVDKIIIN